jgi:hypothetical protein
MLTRSNGSRLALGLTAALLAVVGVGCSHHYGRYGYYREEVRARCGSYMDRIATDREKLDDLEPGRHEKARQWYLDDLHDAERDLDRCRDRIG